MTVEVPEGMRGFVEASVRSGRFHSEDEVVSAALSLLQSLEDTRGRRLADLQVELIKGIESGAPVRFDEQCLGEIIAEGERKLAAQRKRSA